VRSIDGQEGQADRRPAGDDRGLKGGPEASGKAERARVVENLDVLIVGAGLSGIGAAHHLQTAFPGKSYAILEARDAIGGTWDLFRYPGVRSDSDMYTLGYRFRPWTEARAIADGTAILSYVRVTAAEAGIERHVRFGYRVTRAAWSSEQARWTVEAERPDGETATLTCGFLLICSGYYRYDQGYLRSIDKFPRAGSRAPWRLGMSYAHDLVTLRHGKIDDGSMRFSRPPRGGRERLERAGTHSVRD
jgi:NAD(P)-binding Rossmann-like domain